MQCWSYVFSKLAGQVSLSIIKKLGFITELQLFQISTLNAHFILCAYLFVCLSQTFVGVCILHRCIRYCISHLLCMNRYSAPLMLFNLLKFDVVLLAVLPCDLLVK